MMALTSPLSAASSSHLVLQFNGLTAPAVWGAPLPIPGPNPPSSGPGPGPFPLPPLLVLLIPVDGHMMTSSGIRMHGVLLTVIVMMTDPITQLPTMSFIGNSTIANFQVDNRLTAASLNATVNGLDLVSFSPRTLTVTVTWTAQDPLTGKLNPIIRTNSESHFRTGGFSLVMHMSSQMRFAIASGTITVQNGPTIPLPPSPAAIAKVDFGTI